MAWSKDAQNTTTYLDYGVAPVTGTGARTVFLKFRTTDTYADFTRMGGWGTSAAGQRYGWRLEHAGSSYHFRYECDNGAAYGSTTGLNDGAWHSVCFGNPASDNMTNSVICLDGAEETVTVAGTSTLNTGSSSLRIGMDGALSAVVGAICEYAEIAVWDRLLSVAERTLLTGNNISPLSVPSQLILYSPLVRNLEDQAGLGSVTENGTANASIVAHPPLTYWSQGKTYSLASAGGGSSVAPLASRHLNNLMSA